YSDLKRNFIPVNHIKDQMRERDRIRQGGRDQSDQIKDIAIRIRQLAEQIDEGKTITWKQRILKLLDAMKPELRLVVSPKMDLMKEKYGAKEYNEVVKDAIN